MSAYLLLLLAVPLFLALGFSGCVGEDPELTAAKKDAEEKSKRVEQLEDELDKIGKDKAAKAEERKYSNVILKEPNLVCLWRLSSGDNGNSVAEDWQKDLPQHGEFKGGVNKEAKGALSLVSDPADKAVFFDGSQGHVEVPFHTILNPPQSFSIELWIKPEASPAGGAVLSSCEMLASGKVKRGYLLEVIFDPDPKLLVRLGHDIDESVFTVPLGDGSEHDGWRHVVVSYDAPVHRVRIYVNADSGAFDLESGGAGQPPIFFTSNLSSHLRIAANSTPTNTPTDFFKGAIDEVALYAAAIPGSTVRDHFLSGTSVPA